MENVLSSHYLRNIIKKVDLRQYIFFSKVRKQINKTKQNTEDLHPAVWTTVLGVVYLEQVVGILFHLWN